MKKLLCSALIAPVILFSAEAIAHRVNLFAWVEGDAVQAEAKFSGGARAMNARITATDKATGKLIASGTTDGKGAWHFALDAKTRSAAHDILLVIDAGEGHRNEWTVPASDFAQGAAAPEPPSGQPAQEPALQPSAGPAPGVCVSRAELEAIVSRALDARLAPVMRAVAENRDEGPKLSEIVGGIGWIVGLFGIAAYLRRRRSE